MEDISNIKKKIFHIRSTIASVWGNQELKSIFDREHKVENNVNIHDTLHKNEYPIRSNPEKLNLRDWQDLNEKFCKDGYMYLMRGDHPNQESGFYSIPYAYMKLTTENIAGKLENPNECNYLLYGIENFFKYPTNTSTVTEELATLQSEVGGSSFISTTTNIKCARAGTGNQPDKEKQEKYRIYIIKVKKENCFKRPEYLDGCGMKEEEYLIPDYIDEKEIEISFSRNDIFGVYNYLKEKIGLNISPGDIGLSEKEMFLGLEIEEEQPELKKL